jgi:outer membrane protein assembly factor BamB
MRKHNWMLFILIILILSYCISVTSRTSASSSTDDWTMFRHDQNHSGYTTGNSPTNSAKLLWNFTTMEAVASSPAVANGYVFAGCKDGAVYCINASNGKLIWYYYSTGSEVNSSPAIYNGHVYVGSDDGYIYCIDIATGKLFWKSAIGGFVRSSPAIVDGRVYIGSGDHDVFCLDASDGTKIWSYPTSYRVHSSPAVTDGVVYVATDDFHVYALNASTGKEMWHTHTGSVISSPSVYNGYVYIGSIDGYVCSLNASTGTKIWQYQTKNSVSSSPAVAYGCVYVGSDDNNVYCLNATNGKKIWQSPTGYWVWSSPVVQDGNVYVGSEDYNIYCLNASTGAKKWSYTTGNYVDSSPAIVNDTLYVSSYDHHVYALALYNSTAENLPPQPTNSLPWTTITFDVIACAIGAAIISVIALFIHTTRRVKQNAENKNIPIQKVPWFSKHADALCILAILAFSTIFFVNLGSGPLWAADEQTYSQWAFHMVKTGDYLNPWAFGELALWIGKPPLFMWLMSLSYQIFGVNNFASRFWSAVFGALSLVVVFYLGRKLYNLYVGFLSALVLGTFTTFYVFARHAMTDVTFVFLILASIYFVLLSEKTEKTNQYVVLSGLFFGLALMTKQIIALLIPLIVFSYFTATKRSIRFLFTKRFALFWGVGLLVVSPWVIYMTIHFGSEFWQVFLVYSNITRAISPVEGHVEGYLYYFSYLVNNENLVWAILLPFAAGLCAFNSFIKRSKGDILILVWMSIVLGVFTFAQTKIFWYILPAFPAFAIAISSLLYQLSKIAQRFIRLLLSKIQKLVEIAKFWKQRRHKQYS